MPKPRQQIVDLDITSFYHCISRCVRRAFLCGDDPLTGHNFDHRKQWIADRQRELAAIFAIDICSYGLMSNHAHSVLHIDWMRARGWSDNEVADRYACLFESTVELARSFPAAIWAERVAVWRSRLYDLSWFMRCLNESIARRANREDDCTGRFWEGRFRSQALLDPGALLTCMVYVDLNPIRAGIADSLEDSLFTSIRARLISAATPSGLAPFHDQIVVAGEPERQALPMVFGDYVETLEWTVAALRQARAEQEAELLPELAEEQSRREESERKPGPAAAAVPPLLRSMGLDGEGFLHTLKNFPRSFFTMVGHIQLIDTAAKRRRYKRRPGREAARRLYSARSA